MLEIHASGALILKNDQISVLEVQTAPVLAFHLFGGQALEEAVTESVIPRILGLRDVNMLRRILERSNRVVSSFIGTSGTKREPILS